jgi:hypothetical protein
VGQHNFQAFLRRAKGSYFMAHWVLVLCFSIIVFICSLIKSIAYFKTNARALIGFRERSTVTFLESGTHMTRQLQDYQMVPILMFQVLTGHVLLLLLYLPLNNKSEEYFICIFPSGAGSGASGSFSVFLESLQLKAGMLKGKDTVNREFL